MICLTYIAIDSQFASPGVCPSRVQGRLTRNNDVTISRYLRSPSQPTPLYFMDEIDAALDFRNVSIIANYIKSKTEAAQL